MRSSFAVLIGLLLAGGAAPTVRAESTAHQDQLIESYFAIWDQDANVTADNVAKLYAPSLVYYGLP